MNKEENDNLGQYFCHKHEDIGVRADFFVAQILEFHEEFQTLAWEHSYANRYIIPCTLAVLDLEDPDDVEEFKQLQVNIAYMQRNLQWLNDHLAHLEEWRKDIKAEFEALRCEACKARQDVAIEELAAEVQVAQA